MFENIIEQLVSGIKNTSVLEYIAVIFGIVSVILSRRENILVFPTGLVNTILFSYLCYFTWELYAEASVNIFYTIVSIYGWVIWARKNGGKPELKITMSTKREWLLSFGFFALCWLILFLILNNYSDSTVPIADSFAAAAAYTAMLLMARKKVESWIWWIITNMASIPLYFYKTAVFTSFQYIVFLILAVMGLITWANKARSTTNN